MPKGSDGRYFRVGLVGPKPRPKGVGDGQTVDIPLPLAADEVRWRGRGEVGPPSRWRSGGHARRGARPEAWGRRDYSPADRVEPRGLGKPPAGCC